MAGREVGIYYDSQRGKWLAGFQYTPLPLEGIDAFERVGHQWMFEARDYDAAMKALERLGMIAVVSESSKRMVPAPRSAVEFIKAAQDSSRPNPFDDIDMTKVGRGALESFKKKSGRAKIACDPIGEKTGCVAINTTDRATFGITVSTGEEDDDIELDSRDLAAEVFNRVVGYGQKHRYGEYLDVLSKTGDAELCDFLDAALPSKAWLRSQRAYLRSLPRYMLAYLRRYVSGAGGDADLYEVVNGIASRAPLTTEPFAVWRGMREDEGKPWLQEAMLSGVVKPEFLAPISASAYTRISLKFAGNLMLRIAVPKGVPVLAIGGFESEIVLPSQTLRLIKFSIKPYASTDGAGCGVEDVLTADATAGYVEPVREPSEELQAEQERLLQVSIVPIEIKFRNLRYDPRGVESIEMINRAAFELNGFGETWALVDYDRKRFEELSNVARTGTLVRSEPIWGLSACHEAASAWQAEYKFVAILLCIEHPEKMRRAGPPYVYRLAEIRRRNVVAISDDRYTVTTMEVLSAKVVD